MSREHRMVGPPGTGKTTYLAKQIAWEAQERGGDAVVALSLTNAAAQELASRHVPIPEQNVGTLHSMAYRGLGQPKLLQDDDGIAGYNECCKPAHRLTGTVQDDRLEVGEGMGGAGGDKLMAEYARLRACMVPQSIWSQDVAAFAHDWEGYKRGTAGVDFTDMLEFAIADLDACPGDPEVLFADEFQDFSKLAMTLLWKWAEEAEVLVSGGDPDQSIFGFAGSSPETFIEHPPAKQKVLEQSYRVPRAIHKFALAWIEKNQNRERIVYRPRDAEGKILKHKATYRNPETLMKFLTQDAEAGRTCMVLATCGYMLKPLLALLRKEGLPFHNPYRPAEHAWNPLNRHRRGQTTTCERVFAYLQPWLVKDAGQWTGGAVDKWMKMLKGLRARGSFLEDEYGEKISDDRRVTDDMMLTLIPNTAKAMKLIGGPPEGLQVIREHLTSRFATSAEYILCVAEKRGTEALVQPPAITIGTMHSVKGGEADRVYLWPDLSPFGYQEWLMKDGREAIRRLLYVGLTRAREEVVLLAPSSDCSVVWGA